jgi:hypothetical protein
MNGMEYREFQMTDRSMYKGYVLFGTLTPHGLGDMSGPSFRYNGEFKHGLFDGFGNLTYHLVAQSQQNCVHQYEGGFQKGRFSGQGQARYYVPPMVGGPGLTRMSTYYSGGWMNGVKTGYGTMMWANGQTYVGGWNNDVEDGHGKLTWNQFQRPRYEGGWKNGLYEGFGKYFGADGNCEYEGGYKAGRKEGYGTYAASDGRWYSGTWQNDVRIK